MSATRESGMNEIDAAQMRALADDEWDSDDMRMARDCLRGAADELVRQREANASLRSDLKAVMRVYARRRDIIAFAPHTPGCSWHNTVAGLSCNCWKKGAL